MTIRDRQGIAVAEEEKQQEYMDKLDHVYVRRYGEVIFIPDTTGNRY